MNKRLEYMRASQIQGNTHIFRAHHKKKHQLRIWKINWRLVCSRKHTNTQWSWVFVEKSASGDKKIRKTTRCYDFFTWCVCKLSVYCTLLWLAQGHKSSIPTDEKCPPNLSFDLFIFKKKKNEKNEKKGFQHAKRPEFKEISNLKKFQIKFKLEATKSCVYYSKAWISTPI